MKQQFDTLQYLMKRIKLEMNVFGLFKPNSNPKRFLNCG